MFTLDDVVAVVKPHNDRILAEAKLAVAERKNAKLTAALHQCEEYFDGRADVSDGSYGIPQPNTEMRILSEIREALGRA